jgi:hypothetical protein
MAKARPQQTELPGIEQKKIAPIEKAAEEYANERDARMAQSKLETEAGRKLIELLHKYDDQIKWGRDKKGNKVYQRGDIKITLEQTKEKAKVRIGEDEDADDDGGDEPEEESAE